MGNLAENLMALLLGRRVGGERVRSPYPSGARRRPR